MGTRPIQNHTDLVAARLHRYKRNYYQVLPGNNRSTGALGAPLVTTRNDQTGEQLLPMLATYRNPYRRQDVPGGQGTANRATSVARAAPWSFFPSPFFEKKGDPPEGLRPCQGPALTQSPPVQ